ncbi:hypothetical protein FOQG_06276 [Fusarium oxysporum f. sp. raphani 54005]|uniref:Uncharacterized protein n=1 Tax=Fusarium oxysporum f. sp. raphani 54005 TaxID=1089458 RepID=X0CL23_FUSOX|nr:hypothetical protein FOQG_06276 [Fusarium oxysporum f. sp. raphani 54005]EXK91525.1 hypothetical protein FOQG_06276 [Fusarium oxysporum f. sp. raphani 54005]EXK91526.1 hypothetical protein FOQG_06276 [Fusarium oxysporum f. sp. raphani 54005]
MERNSPCSSVAVEVKPSVSDSLKAPPVASRLRPTARPSVSWPVIGFDAKLLSNPPFDLPMGAQIGNERECICKLSLNGSVCAVSLKTMDIGHSL